MSNETSAADQTRQQGLVHKEEGKPEKVPRAPLTRFQQLSIQWVYITLALIGAAWGVGASVIFLSGGLAFAAGSTAVLLATFVCVICGMKLDDI